MIKLFIFGFLQVFFVAQQTRNAAQSRYIQFFFTSMLIAFIWSYAIKELFIERFDLLHIAIYGIGTGFGGIVGILLHKKLMKKKEVEKW